MEMEERKSLKLYSLMGIALFTLAGAIVGFVMDGKVAGMVGSFVGLFAGSFTNKIFQ